jgi:glycosyltransferase involved in cell wall biosynthesis
MRIAFYAPLKPPTAPSPSGDRHMARLLMRALTVGGHQVELAAIFRSRDGDGNALRQARLGELGGRLAHRLVERYGRRPRDARPGTWFTYHLYHKAPDWLGPAVSDALGIPYVVAEASFAPKRKGGKWALGHEAAGRAIRRADAIIGLNSNDAPCVLPLLDDPRRLFALSPFTETAPFAAAAAESDRHRHAVGAAFGLDMGVPLLLAVAMMRSGDKLESYQVLGAALATLDDIPWQLLVVGDGPARMAVEAALAALGDGRVRYAGELPPDELAPVYAAADLLIWPAVREAYGMAILEAQAAGVPVVAGNSGGVGDIVAHGRTGLLTATGDAAALADAVRTLLADPGRRADMGRRAGETVGREHTIAAAAARLNQALAAAGGAVGR